MFVSSELEKKLPESPKLDIKETPSAFYCADVVDTTRSFARNFGGYVRNDIAIINEQNNVEVAMSLVDRLVQRPSDGKVDLPDEKLRLAYRSKYCQTPSEQCLWYEEQLRLADQEELHRLEEEQKAREKEELRQKRELFSKNLTQEERDKIRQYRREKDLREYAES